MKKLFTFFLALALSVGTMLADCVPSVPEPQDGYVTFVIRIPLGTECNGIAFKGTRNGSWTDCSGTDTYVGENAENVSPDACIKFEPIEGYQGWFKATYRLGIEAWGADAIRFAGKICLIYHNDRIWDGQAASFEFLEDYCTASHSLSNDKQIQIQSSGLIYAHIFLWNKSQCATAAVKQRTITVTFPECGMETPTIVGSFNDWDSQSYTMTHLNGNTYTAVVQASDFDAFTFASAENGWANDLHAYGEPSSFQNRFCIDTNISLDLSQNTRWRQCAEGNTGTYDYKITFQAFDYSLRTLYLQNGEAIVAPTPPVIDGYEFLGWDQSFNVANSSMVINAIYQEIGFTGFVNCDIFSCNYIFDAQRGTIDGPTVVRSDSPNITCTATPKRGYQFVRWADGNTDNPRTIEITQDTTMEAIFDYLLEGKCGKDSVLTWKLDTATMALNITGKGALSENYTYGKYIESVTIGNEVTSIGGYAFGDYNNLKNVTLGISVKVLEEYAFYNCYNIETITCYSQRPPTVNNYALYRLDYSTIVYVPADYLNTYKMHDAWGLYDVRPLGATSAETDDIKVTPTETTAEVVWPAVSGAATYELVIRDKDGNVICTLIFNAQGQLTQIAFGAPARDNAPQQTQSTGFSFTVTGLESGTGYDLTMTAKDTNGTTLQENTMSFITTGGEQGVEDVSANFGGSRKLLRNGQILILRGDKTYTLTGQEIR
ncbi:MAG: leucine-rich repeat protein [Paludibacteraceae bacterium]|nr:leucine-rich repeat protein [Paludibacteraceae bacterium]